MATAADVLLIPNRCKGSDTKYQCILFRRLCPSSCTLSLTSRHIWTITNICMVLTSFKVPLTDGLISKWLHTCPDVGEESGTLSRALPCHPSICSYRTYQRGFISSLYYIPGTRAAVLIVRRHRERPGCVNWKGRFLHKLICSGPCDIVKRRIPSWTQILLPSWHLKKLASCTSYKPCCRIVNDGTLITHDHQFGATSVYLIFYSESTVPRVFLWISCSSSSWTLDCLVCFRFKSVSNFFLTPFIGKSLDTKTQTYTILHLPRTTCT